MIHPNETASRPADERLATYVKVLAVKTKVNALYYDLLLFRRAVCFGFNANRQSANSRRRRQAIYGGGLSMASHPIPWRVHGIGEVLAFARSVGFFNVNAAQPHRA